MVSCTSHTGQTYPKVLLWSFVASSCTPYLHVHTVYCTPTDPRGVTPWVTRMKDGIVFTWMLARCWILDAVIYDASREILGWDELH